MASQAEQRNPVEVLSEEFLDRYRRGEKPSVAEYADAHPELADEISALFPAMLAMERLKAGRPLSSGRPLDAQIEGLEQLGDYRIIREIGRGGMGIVYEAEQQSLGRTVAVKIFPRHVLEDSRRLKRFHREARTAARLHHTNIVPVFGVGRQGGLHYYVMQLIKGIALDEVIAALGLQADAGQRTTGNDGAAAPHKATSGDTTGFSALDAAESLRNGRPSKSDAHRQPPEPPRSLLALTSGRVRSEERYWHSVAKIGFQVAEALSYAHAQEILHRDIKPDNLLLDARGTVWVTDFGLARVAAQERLSNPGDVVGTLRYMAPEVLTGEHDARSDVYSLGLTLYELLTWQPAFAEERSAQLIQEISKSSPRPPRSIRPEIPRDLEAIVLKAIARQPSRRYQTAANLAQDLRCFLEARPVRARRTGVLGQLVRWGRRNPAIAALSCLLLLVAVASFVAVSVKWRDAVQEHRRAEGNLSLALDSMEQVLDRFASSWMSHPSDPPEGDQEAAIEFRIVPSARSVGILQEALRFYDQFARQNATNPRLRHATAKAHQRVGDIHERLGQYKQAEEAYQHALKAYQDYSAQHADNAAVATEIAATRNLLGLAMFKTGRLEAAQEQFQRAQALLLHDADPQSPLCRYELARTHNNLGNVLWMLRQPRTARDSQWQALKLLKELVQEYPQDAAYRLALARAYRSVLPFSTRGNWGRESVEMRAAGIGLLEELVKDFPDVPDYQCELSEMLSAVYPSGPEAAVDEQATSNLLRAVELARQLVATHPTIPRYRAVLANALRRQADSLQRANPADAVERYVDAVQHYRELANEFPSIQVYELYLAMTLRDYSDTLQELNRPVEARPLMEEAVARHRTYWSQRPDDRFGRGMLARSYEDLAKLLQQLGDQSAADKARREARQLQQRMSPRDWP